MAINHLDTNEQHVQQLLSFVDRNLWQIVDMGGGYVEAATDEEMVSTEFINDRLIVFFKRSTWELSYTGNQVQPFIWQKFNSERIGNGN